MNERKVKTGSKTHQHRGDDVELYPLVQDCPAWAMMFAYRDDYDCERTDHRQASKTDESLKKSG